MKPPSHLAADLSHWRPVAVLKSDHFSTVERGFWRENGREVEAVLRRFDDVPWWMRPVAYHFGRREANALARLGGIAGPRLLAQGDGFLVRSWIDGLPMHLARPEGDAGYFRMAKRMLFAMHRAGVVHNDLAKEQNWLRDSRGRPQLTDFQLAHTSDRRGRLFRLAAHEDLRHLLKHKRKYVPNALTAQERRVLATKSLPARVWMATGKQLYIFVTRRLLGYMDREGSGADATRDGPRITARLAVLSGVTGAAVVAYPTPRGARLYAFVETAAPLSETDIRAHLASARDPLPDPNLIQISRQLPRSAEGDLREDVLRLVAQNQVDLIAGLSLKGPARRAAAELVAGRLNRTDRRLRKA
ncbi:MAG: serine/threonine protein kinase [Xanthobacteraceae bacterium]